MRKSIFGYLLIIIFITLFLPISSLRVKAIPPRPTALGALPGYFTQAGEVETGTVVWYSFEVGPGNYWGIIQLIGYQEKGSVKFTVYDANMNAFMGNYTHSGSHMCEAVFRPEGTDTCDEFMPRLNRNWTYYIAIEGTGEFDLSVYSTNDDYAGSYDNATAMTIGNTYDGSIERSDDIDCFMLTLPKNGINYQVSLYATKKMTTTICDSYDNPMAHTGLNVMRDRQKSETVFKGNGQTLYFYLKGNGGTVCRLSSSVKTNVTNITESNVVASVGSKYIYIYTLKQSRVTVTTNKKILSGSKTRKVIKSTSKAMTKVKLKRKLKKGDVIRVVIEKGRLKKYIKKIKVK